MATNRWQKLIFRLSLTLCLASFLLVVLTVYSYWQEKHQTVEKARDDAKRTAQNAAQEIDKKLSKFMPIVDSLGNHLSVGKFNEGQFREKLKETIDTNPEIFEVGAAYKPFEFNPSLRLYAPHYGEKDGQLQFFQLEESYDYTQSEWYKDTITKSPNWIEPYFGQATKALVTGFAVPFYRPDDSSQQIGVVRANLSLQDVRKIVSSLELGKTGFGFLLSKTGTFISYPLEKYVKKQKTIFDLAKEFKDNEKLREMGEKAINGERGEIDEYIDKLTGQSAWIFYEPIDSTCSPFNGEKRCWSLGVVFFKDEIFFDTEDTDGSKRDVSKSLRRKLIWSSLGAVLFFFFLSILLFRAYRGSIRSLWAVSSSASVLLGTGIGFILHLTLAEQRQMEQRNNVVLLGPAGLEKYLDSQRQRQHTQELPIYVPTGVFVQSIEFQSANNVSVTGYIWQKYSDDIIEKYPDLIPDDETPGFILPEAIEPKISKYYRREEDNYKSIGWYFEAVLRQNFDYSQYPFDDKNVWLRLWHKNFDKNVILVPDFEAYNISLSPSSKPGLEKDFVLPGWNIERSFFQYRINSYNTNFGIKNYVRQEDFPELYFTVHIKRDFLNVFIGNLITPIVVVFLLFLIQWIVIKKTRKNQEIEFSALDIVAACSALIFIMIIDQINLRQKIITAGIIYIDYYYFILYLLIVAVAINGALFASHTNIRWIEYEGNLIPKLLYWPTFLMLLLIVTLFVFY